MTARCALHRRERRLGGARRGTVVALHSDGAETAELWPLCGELPFDAVAPQGPRARDPFHSSAAPGDPRWSAYSGHSWFRRDDQGRPEPASFGDALEQIESLVRELAPDGPVFLVGRGAGATLARGAAWAIPELLAAVVALGGEWPEIPGWSDSFVTPARLPVLELSSDTDPCGAAGRIAVFLEARREGARDGRSRSQEADQDLLQAHLHR